jgi:rhomboid protease GluP
VEPVISYLLLATNLAVHAFGISLALTHSDVASNDFFLSLANDPAKVAAGETWRLLSSTFLHAGLLHLGLNCWALGVVAPEAEAVLGYTTFAYVYLASGLAGSVLNLYGSGTVAVGASGAICGCLGALLGYFLRNPSLERSGKQVLFILAVAGANLILGTDPDAMIDNLGHVGGLVAGTWLGYSMGPRFMVSREVDIPEGAMFVPEDAKEVAVVIDQSSGLGRLAVGLSFAASLGVAAAAGIALQNGA